MQILTQTSTMPGSSFSLPARRTCPGMLDAPSSVCTFCYADDRKRYRWSCVKRSQAERFAWTLEALRTGSFVPVLVGHILARRDRFIRLHDSGDFFAPAYVDAWADVVRALPHVSFWAPTHSWAERGQLRNDADPLMVSLRSLAALSNITVRPSALFLGDEPPVIPGLAAGSTVTIDRFRTTCPKYLRHPPFCGDCRSCWDSPSLPVTYLKH